MTILLVIMHDSGIPLPLNTRNSSTLAISQDKLITRLFEIAFPPRATTARLLEAATITWMPQTQSLWSDALMPKYTTT